MTTNHPAHGPVSLERLHQISEILSKAAAQSDGGNLGYAMADAVKVIDSAIASFGAEDLPKVCAEAYQVVGVMAEALGLFDNESVQKCLDNLSQRKIIHNDVLPLSLPCSNSPATPDCWIPVSERMPEDGEHVIVFHPRDGVMQITFFFAYGKWWDAAEDEGGLAKSYFTHWQPLPAAPQQEDK